MTDHPEKEEDFPTARPAKPKTSWIGWALPALALGFTAWLWWSANRAQGPLITITFEQGNGLKAGDTLRHRGIPVGTVERLALSATLKTVIVDVRLQPEAASLARDGSQFWIVHPRLGLQKASGLETVVGAKYLRIQPGEGPPKTFFEGLSEPPDSPENAGALHLTLHAARSLGLQEGAPVSTRDIRVGTVRTVRLPEPDALKNTDLVEIGITIQAAHRHRVSSDTKFFKRAGASAEFGLFSGFKLDVGSVEDVIAGGVAFATPTDPEALPVDPSSVFVLHPKAEEKWIEWWDLPEK